MLCAVEKVWGAGGVETPVVPDEPDDSTPVMPCKDLGWMPWRRVRRVRRVVWWFSFVHIPLATEHPVCCPGTWALHRLSEHGYLLPERQVLKDQLTVIFEQCAEKYD
jgi:hypothetical protein